mmetsp:Transcript_34869/g.107932  ORF Transcript_34869/g.107932 Transcript_34869/m.107932 type:complete len:231 (-) Transcript_34869:800-1492(-)
MKFAAQDVCAFMRSLTEFLVSATLDSNSLRNNSGAKGSACTRSPVRRPARTAARSNASELQMMPAKFLPVATICAPVRVAMSTTTSTGLLERTPGVVACETPSASTRRPSASVLLISQVKPLKKRMMSSQRSASLPMAFSATHRTQWSSDRSPPPSAQAASNAPRHAAAPPRSDFMPTIPPPTLSDNPPVSKHMPLPTSAADRPSRSNVAVSTTSAGGDSAHLPTPQSPP